MSAATQELQADLLAVVFIDDAGEEITIKAETDGGDESK